jgi:proline racemase
MTLATIDAHAGGAPIRLIVSGAPSPVGRTMREKTEWMVRHADHVRQTLMREPRGHRDMIGAMLTEPVKAGSHAGVVFMHAHGYASMSGHGVIGVTAMAQARALIVTAGGDGSMVFDTVAGPIRVPPDPRAGSATDGGGKTVRFANVPSFVLRGGVPISVGPRTMRVDVAYGGVFYAIVDAEAAGLGLDGRHLTSLGRMAADIKARVEAAMVVAHPIDPAMKGLGGVLFTGPATDARAQLRSVTILAGGSAGRSASGTGLSAVMAVLDAMGLLADETKIEQEGLSGARFSGTIASRTQVGDLPAIVPLVEGSAWITGEHQFFVDPSDPFGRGFSLE